MKQLIVRVKGNILVKTNNQVFPKGIACASIGTPLQNSCNKPGNLCDDTFVIDGDLILDENTAVLPYATYVATKGAMACVPCRPAININSWFARNHDILEKVGVEIPEESNTYYYNGLYLALCSSLELALMDIFMMKITSVPMFYEYAAKYWIKMSKVIVNESTINYDDYFQQVITYFMNSVIYHRFDQVNNIYIEVLGVEIPPYNELNKAFRRRNNIVHRYSLSNLDRITITNANANDIRELAMEIETFLRELEDRVKISK